MHERTTASPWVRPMHARDRHEPHRVSTPLELLFDLCFVVAVSYASAELHHGLAEGHYDRIIGYCMVFFAIWWAWLNFAWFASAYDTDDVPYRLTVLVKIAGVLLVAAGVPAACDARDFAVVTVGYTLMRVALVAQWLRASRGDPKRAKTLRRYAGGIVVVQLAWLALLAAPPAVWIIGFCMLLPTELLLPWWAERAGDTPWHRHHIAERYGLLTLIVLGESVLSATTAIRTSVEAHALSAPMFGLIAGSLLTLFAMWWIYFEQDAAELLEADPNISFLWGYGHLVIFASAAAVGAGLGVAVDALAGHSQLPEWAQAAPVAVPVALFLFSVWLLQIRLSDRGGHLGLAFGITGASVLACSGTRWGVPAIGLLLSALVAWMVRVHGMVRSSTHLHTKSTHSLK